MFSSWCLLYLLTLLCLVSSAVSQAIGSSSSSSPTRTLAALDAPTIVTTVTKTSAITVVSGSPLVGIVDFSTTTSTITIINPTSTTFVTVTVTPSPRLSELANELAPNAISTTTTTVLTTVFTPPVILKTRVITELALTTFAGVTVTITITVGVPTPTRDISSGVSVTRSSTVPTETGTETGDQTMTAGTGTGTGSSSSSLGSVIVTRPTTTRTSTGNTIMTMVTSTSSTSSTSSQTPTETPEPIPPPDGFSQEMDRTRLAGIIISSILLALLLAGVTLWLIRRRRRRQRYIQELILPRTGGSAGIVGVLRTNSSTRRTGVGPRLTRRVSIRHDPLSRPSPARTSPPRGGATSPDSPSHSGLTGEGEVRIVIRPAPRNRRTASSHIFPVPPGYGGQNPNMFVEETTTGETTPENPDKWSIASDQGSRGTSNNDRGVGGGNVTGSSSGGRPSGYTESYPLVTVLSPTPVARGNRQNVAPWEAETPPRRPGTNDGGSSGQRSARSGRTDQTGSSGGRAILGGSSRFPNVF